MLVYLFVGTTRVMVGGRNDDAISKVVESLAQAMAQNQYNNQNVGENDEFHALGDF